MPLAAAALLLAGCPDRQIAIVEPDQVKVESKDIPVNPNRKLDILFLIDKSPTMEDEQTALAANFPRFIESLSQVEGGLPSIHIGVISQDIGAGGLTVGQTCTGAGDDGRLLSQPRVAGCTPPNGNFIADLDQGNGNRMRNYTGSLEETFSCIANLGPDGCGFEQHLGSLDKALHSPANAGFLRPDALLAIIIISDEDDCTAKDPTIYEPGTNAAGPFGDFRCFQWGWECDEGPLGREPGTYTNCRPREDSPFLHTPDRFVESIKALKADPKQIIVSTIMGPSATTFPAAETTTVVTDPMTGGPKLAPACTVGNQSASSMPRLAYFAEQFPDRNSFFSLCNDDDNDGQADLEQGLSLVAQLIKRVFGNPCFESDVTQEDLDPANPGLQIECAVSDRTATAETTIPACRMADATTPAADAKQPCWYLKPDVEQCREYPSKLLLAVHPEDRTVPEGTVLMVQCVTQ